MTIYRIEINPRVKIQYITPMKISVDIGNRRIIISGVLSNRYFIRNIKYYVSPIEIDTLYKKLCDSSDGGEYDYKDYISVINMLIEKEVLIIRQHHKGSEANDRKIKITYLNYTNQEILPLIETVMENFINKESLEESVFYDCLDIINTRERVVIEEGMGNLLVPILWSYNPYDSSNWSEWGKVCTVLPVVCNYNYFSIGPQICGDKTWRIADRVLVKEKNRYSYINPEPSEGYLPIMIAFLMQQIQYYVEAINDWERRIRVNDEIITYNYNAYSLDVKKYVFPGIKARTVL